MLIEFAVAVAACAPASCAPAEPATVAVEFAMRALAAHNLARAAACVPPLAWDAKAAAAADDWARHLAVIGDMVHSGEPDGEVDAVSGEGENLFAGTRGAYSVEQMIGLWADERRQLAKLTSWADDLSAVGHYTQMVWSTTTHVGCAVAVGRTEDFLVCRYTPPGNIDGHQPIPAAATPAAGRCAASAAATLR